MHGSNTDTGTFAALLGLGLIWTDNKQKSVLWDTPDTSVWVCRGTADESNLHRDLQRDLRYPAQWDADFYWEITEKPLGWIGIPNTKLCQGFNRSLTSSHKSTTFQWGLYPAVCLLCSEECEHGGHCEEKMWGKLPITSEPEGKVTLELTGNTNH